MDSRLKGGWVVAMAMARVIMPWAGLGLSPWVESGKVAGKIGVMMPGAGAMPDR